jgi:hypothetical protein
MTEIGTPPLTDYELYLLRYTRWSINTHGGKEAFGDRVHRTLFGDLIADKFLGLGLIEPWGTTRLGDPAYRLTTAGTTRAQEVRP